MSPIAAAEAFERAPLLAERVGEGDVESVLARARELIAGMTEEHKVAVLNAHPRIGARAGLSPRSAAEQRSDEEADPTTLAELERLNDAYERTFGFRCVVFVRGRSRAELVPIIRARLARSREAELAAGIDAFLAIARDRLERP